MVEQTNGIKMITDQHQTWQITHRLHWTLYRVKIVFTHLYTDRCAGEQVLWDVWDTSYLSFYARKCTAEYNNIYMQITTNEVI